MKKLAFCFLIYDKINHEELWNNWFKNIDKKKYKIFIHYKKNIILKYFEKYKLDYCIETKYADISLVKAQNLLIQNSINNNCTHQILLSDSCIPLKSFNHIYKKLNPLFSYFNLLPANLYKHTKIIGKTTLKISKIHKSSQWCILNKKHSKIILKDRIIYKKLSKCYAPDELVYLTILNKYNKELIITNNLTSGATTFTNWSDMNYPYQNHMEIKNYEIITLDEINYLIKQPCLFGRKFKSDCKIIKRNGLLYEDDLSQYLTKRIIPKEFLKYKVSDLICKNKYGTFIVPKEHNRPVTRALRKGKVYEPKTIEFIRKNYNNKTTL